MPELLATYLHDLSPHIVHFGGGFALHWYGLAYVLGFYCTYLVMQSLARRGFGELAPNQVADFITLVAFFGVVAGGRLGYMLLYNREVLLHEPWLVLKLWEGGMASHGGIAGVALVCLWYARKHRISWVGLGDCLVCGAPLGVFFGRIANFINGELFGRVTTHPWAMKFPTELLHEDYLAQGGKPVDLPLHLQHSPDIIAYLAEQGINRVQLAAMLHPRHPSQLYEALGEGLLLTLILLGLRLTCRNLPRGVLTGLFFILYATARIALENLRQPDSGAQPIWGLTPGQFYSTFMIATGAAFLAYAFLSPKARVPSARPAAG